jgi:hypothetical protein
MQTVDETSQDAFQLANFREVCFKETGNLPDEACTSLYT